MNENKYMVLSTCFTRMIDGHEIEFNLLVDSRGKLSIKPTLPEYVQNRFPDGLVMEFLDDKLLIYPYDPTPTTINL